MKGDFSRGYRPDHKRGRPYRRVLLQQGRVVLDSDQAAMVDAEDHNLRELGSLLGDGSPDLGFLVSAGRLLACFDTLEQVRPGPGIIHRRDHAWRMHGRLPSLYLEADARQVNVNARASASIELRREQQSGTSLQVWVRSEGPVELGFSLGAESIFGVPINASQFTPVLVAVAEDSSSLRVSLRGGSRVWIGLIESVVNAPKFWLAPGRMLLGGWVLENPEASEWPEQAFPSAAGFAIDPTRTWTNGTELVAYVEAWERVITPHHDPGIREQGLGGELDTSLRTAVVAQVKLVRCASELDDAAIQAAFAQPKRHADVPGTLEVHTSGAQGESRYAGRDNRLYHFEVARGGGLGEAVLTWARDGGASLVPLLACGGRTITLAAGSGLREGELVELLSEVVELGDAEDAQLGVGSFVPSVRARGQLALLKVRETDESGHERFDLVAPDSGAALTLDPIRYGGEGQRVLLRRWHGRVVTQVGQSDYALEHGVKVTLGGKLRAGDWWQWEARVGRDNDNGVWSKLAHGPERRFAPLARLRYAGTTVQLQSWLDRRFRPLAQLDAAQVAFDGAAIDSDAADVQQALEELWQRPSGGFGDCDLLITPSSSPAIDDADRIAAAIASQLPQGGVVGLAPGIYRFARSLIIDRPLTFRGYPRALIQQSSAPAFVVESSGRLSLERLRILDARRTAGVHQLVTLAASSSLDAADVDFCAEGPEAVAISGGASLVEASLDVPLSASEGDGAVPLPMPTPIQAIVLRRCTIVAGVGLRIADCRRLIIADSAIRARTRGVSCAGVERLECVRVRVSTSLTSVADQLGGALEPERLLLSRDGASELAGDDGPAVDGSVALSLGRMLGGSFVDSSFTGAIGVFVDLLSAATLRGCTIRARTHALVLNQVVDARLSELDLRADAIGVRLGFVARDVELSRCMIEAQTGVQIGADTAERIKLVLERLRVVDNRIRARMHGLRFDATANIDDVQSAIADVAITGNRVHQLADAQGNYAMGVGIHAARPGASLVRHQLLIVDNHLTWAAIAMQVAGPGASVRANVITHLLGNEKLASVRSLWIVAAPNVLVSENVASYAGDLEGYVGIKVEGCDGAVLRANIVANERTAIPLDLSMTSAGARVLDNAFGPGTVSVRAGAGLRLLGNRIVGALSVDRSIDAEIANNELGSSTHVFTASDRAVIRDNRSQGSLRIEQSRDVSVLGNRIELRFAGIAGALTINEGAGRWQIISNHANAAVSLRGSADVHVQVLGNQLTDLQVGDEAASAKSSAIVCNNLCSGRIAVHFAQRIVANNFTIETVESLGEAVMPLGKE